MHSGLLRSESQSLIRKCWVLSLPVAVLMLSSCGEESSDSMRDSAETAGAVPAGSGQEIPGLFVRECTYRAVGGPAHLTRTTPSDLQAGDVTFKGVQLFARRVERRYLYRGQGGGGKWRGFKVVTIVRRGMEATAVAPARDRSSFLLLYDTKGHRKRDITYVRSEGQPAVRFTACPRGSQPLPAGVDPPRGRARPRGEFIGGGFLVRRPGCYHVRVVSEANPEPVTQPVNIAMGKGGCSGA